MPAHPTPDAATSPTLPFTSEDSALAYAHFAPQVASLPEAELEVWHGDAGVVRTNVARGLKAVVPHEAVVKQKTRVDFDRLVEMPSLCLALTFAVGRANAPADTTELHVRQPRMRGMRTLTLSQAEILSALGLLQATDVQAIRSAHGALAEATGGVSLAALISAPALAGKHPFTAAQLSQLAEDGNWLLKALKPAGAVQDKAERSPEALVRDQLWTELHRRYEQLLTAGDAILGRQHTSAHVPPLLQREHAAHHDAAVVAPVK